MVMTTACLRSSKTIEEVYVTIVRHDKEVFMLRGVDIYLSLRFLQIEGGVACAIHLTKKNWRTTCASVTLGGSLREPLPGVIELAPKKLKEKKWHRIYHN